MILTISCYIIIDDFLKQTKKKLSTIPKSTSYGVVYMCFFRFSQSLASNLVMINNSFFPSLCEGNSEVLSSEIEMVNLFSCTVNYWCLQNLLPGPGKDCIRARQLDVLYLAAV